eukprot:NODE_1440_length_1417_cov_6.467836_g1197_i0.p6 GENE.NODE_1440_length_1417_cov_6.467836_g1197_i0~~NODE_1440_length_1417_cov_6.467836_g1197_i0.p6  ORF type:complete len:59 (+),score=0.58 NODE_1440_length_1417_cov_6.467836_g1197_i0:535-711(+)
MHTDAPRGPGSWGSPFPRCFGQDAPGLEGPGVSPPAHEVGKLRNFRPTRYPRALQSRS